MSDENPYTAEGPEPGERAVGLEQFQKAALEAVRAARAMLDAAEAIVQDPKAIEVVVASVAGMARDATQAVAGFATGATRQRRPGDEDDGSDGDDDSRDDGFESIDVD